MNYDQPKNRIEISEHFAALIAKRQASDLARVQFWTGVSADPRGMLRQLPDPAQPGYTEDAELRTQLREDLIKITGSDENQFGTLGDLQAVCFQGNCSDVLRRARSTRRTTLPRRLVHSLLRRKALSDKNGMFDLRVKEAAANILAKGAVDVV